MTLTTSPQSDFYALGKHWSALQMRIKRRYGNFSYIKIKTLEGNGVLHVVYAGPYIPQKWISASWNELHASPVVDIRLLRGDNKRIARYLVSHYLANQPYVRMSWSWDWVYHGFVRRWYFIKKQYGPGALRLWDRHLRGDVIQNRDFILYPDGRLASLVQLELA